MIVFLLLNQWSPMINVNEEDEDEEDEEDDESDPYGLQSLQWQSFLSVHQSNEYRKDRQVTKEIKPSKTERCHSKSLVDNFEFIQLVQHESISSDDHQCLSALNS